MNGSTKRWSGLLLYSLLLMAVWIGTTSQTAFSATTSVDQMQTAADIQWRVRNGSGGISSLTFHNLINENHSGVMTYGSRQYGINLVWKTNRPSFETDVFFFENCTRPGDPIYGSDRVAIRVSRGPSDSAYLTYGTRSNGIDLIWSDSQSCEFRFVSPSALGFGATAAADGRFAIYNTRRKAYLVYGSRSRGINLKWRLANPPISTEAKADLVPIRLRWVGNQAVVAIENRGNVPTTQARHELVFSVAGRTFTKPIVSAIAPGESKEFVYALSGLAIEECQPVAVQVDVEQVFQSGQGVFANDLKTLRANETSFCAEKIFLLQQRSLPTTAYQQMADVTIAQALPDMPLADPTICYADGDDPPGSGQDLATLFRWNTSAIPRESQVTAASIALYVANSSQDAYFFYPLWTKWTEDTTWRQMASALEESRDAQPLGVLLPQSLGAVSASLNSNGVEVVQSWVQEEEETNFGVLLINSPAIDGVDFYCRESINPMQRPALAVRYLVNGQSHTTVIRAAADLTIAQALPDVSIGSQASCHADGDDPPSSGNDLTTLLRWDISSLPKGRTIKSAQIILHVTDTTQQPYALYAATRTWDPVDASWQRATPTQSWTQPGGDFGGPVLGQLSALDTGRTALSLNASGLALLASWIDQPSQNRGFLLHSSTATDGLDFLCSESDSPQSRPLLMVEFE